MFSNGEVLITNVYPYTKQSYHIDANNEVIGQVIIVHYCEAHVSPQVPSRVTEYHICSISSPGHEVRTIAFPGTHICF